ncbi:hypothetical protein SAMN05216567_12263 [Variovorax sp. OK605]|uniref:hypothetical protein n=1 Tax=Variovorax sp. OK605 TaxID=1855317 RepID=UPI0008E8C7E5|nr:hypothetical protein [Variovorax sp. OK605]SFQ62180.1 hypothetical protein SAMN05216567_12263 [Variovorax sp. OK605]
MKVREFDAASGQSKSTDSSPVSTASTTVAQAQHAEPTITLYGRIAAGPVGYVSWPDPPDLHFSILIDDAYSGITVLDGQPTMWEAGLRNMALIKTNRYDNATPSGVRVRIPLEPPAGMSRREFAQRIIVRSQKFASYAAPCSAPKNIGGSRMRPGEYNSSSYVAGLLDSVMGHVPSVSTPGFQTPGWENPMPGHFFKGEAIR